MIKIVVFIGETPAHCIDFLAESEEGLVTELEAKAFEIFSKHMRNFGDEMGKFGGDGYFAEGPTGIIKAVRKAYGKEHPDAGEAP